MLAWTISLVRQTIIGTVIFVTFVAGGTYYLQSSLMLVKHYGPYIHWVVILFALPLLAGIAHRFARIRYPLINIMSGTLISVDILYPQYNKLWAVPPTSTNIIIYSIIIFGIGFLATQSIRNTIMIAFRMGKYSVNKLSMQATNGKRTSSPSKSQTVYSDHGQTLAMLELAIGVCSLGLSIFSVFFLGKS